MKFSPPSFLLKPIAETSIGAYVNGLITHDFSLEPRKVRPIIFSHGLTGLNVFYSGICRDLASQGYLVLCPNHQDGSCMYTTSAQNEDIFLDPQKFYIKELRTKQVHQRVNEVLTLASELRQMTPDFERAIFGDNERDAQLDMDELVLMGHSFGGITVMLASATCKDDEVPRACITMDPWQYACASEFLNGEYKIKCPMQVITSEKFGGTIPKERYDYWGCLEATFKNCRHPQKTESVITVGQGHFH
jgi:dienelactone hydrolase